PAVSGSASRSKDGLTHISLVNIDARQPQEVTIDLQGGSFASVQGRILSSAKLQDHNSFTEPQKITPAPFRGASLKGKTLTVTLPPFSVVVLQLK
ncbi:MAG TPA: alpha-L-arabinofuranosidase C-terminal domain-containing protein, partial [Chitinophagaceae bacterium]|nr:alpha-L-arabinofuranosidase C-terminal domain-containing protein [Chitinophagaceae bacterium]